MNTNKQMITGAMEYMRLEGEPYSDKQLAQLWVEQRLGEFGFRLLSRLGVWEAINILNAEKQPSVTNAHVIYEEYIQETLRGIEREVGGGEPSKYYRNIRVDFLTKAHPDVELNHHNFIIGSEIALLPYAMPYLETLNENELAKVFDTDDYKLEKGFLQVIRESEPKDYPLIIKPLLYVVMSEIIMAQFEDIVSQVIDPRFCEAVWWPDTMVQVAEIEKRMYLEAGQRVARYVKSNKAQAAEFFNVYAVDDTDFLIKNFESAASRPAVGLDRDMIRIQCIISSMTFARPDTVVTDLFHVLDDALDMVNGNVNPGVAK